MLKSLIKFPCPQCHDTLSFENVDLAGQTIRCRRCGHLPLKRYSQNTISPELGPSDPNQKQRAHASTAPKVSIQRRGSSLCIRYKWHSKARGFLTFFALIWNGGLGLIIAASLKEGSFPALVSIHALLGLVLGYLALTQWFNSTRVTLSGGRIHSKPGPLPWPGQIEFAARELSQITLQEYVAYSQGPRNGPKTPVYALKLVATLQDGRELDLVKGLQDFVEAVQIEHAIEQTLGITDEPEFDQVRHRA